MKFNAILPLKWQNTADIVAILVGLKQGTTDIVKRLMLLLSTGTTKTRREVGYYADQLGVSMKYLSETVKRQTGNTVMDFIVQYTKPIIIEYLNNPRLSVAQIANALNFTTSNYFTRYCIKHIGMSPTEYRAAHQPKTL